MKIAWSAVAGLGMAGLLVAGTPARAETGKTGSSGSASGQTTSDTTSPGSAGSSSSTMGSPSGSTGTSSDPSATPGSTASEHHATSMGSGTNEVTGKVEKFDKANKELTLSLKVSDTTQVTKDGQSASLTDIKEGDQVRASFSGSGDTLEVTQIEVMSKGSKSSGMGTSGSSGTTGSMPPSSTDTGSTPPSSTDTGSKGSSSGRGY
jgi:Cu/Ag efflux protein CusF